MPSSTQLRIPTDLESGPVDPPPPYFEVCSEYQLPPSYFHAVITDPSTMGKDLKGFEAGNGNHSSTNPIFPQISTISSIIPIQIQPIIPSSSSSSRSSGNRASRTRRHATRHTIPSHLQQQQAESRKRSTQACLLVLTLVVLIPVILYFFVRMSTQQQDPRSGSSSPFSFSTIDWN